MATKKTIKPKVKATPKTTSKAASSPAKTTDTRVITKCLSVAETLLRTLPSLTDVERIAQRTRFSDERCDRIGAGTQSFAVLREAVDWAIKIHRALESQDHLIRSYSKRRLAFLLECIIVFAKACSEQAMKRDVNGTTKMMLEYAHAQAKVIRNELLSAMRHTIGDEDTKARTELAHAMGDTKNADLLAESLGALAALARQWLEEKDSVWKIRVEDAGLTPKFVDEAINAAQALSKATQAKTFGGAVQSRDTPEVNRIEGRVVLELGSAMRIFADAHEHNKTVPTLTPGPATRHVLVHKRKEVEEPVPAKDISTRQPETPAAQ